MKKLSLLIVCATTTFVGSTFNPAIALAQTNQSAIEDTTTVATSHATTEETAAWEAALQSGDPEKFFDFIETYPNGVHIKDAKLKIIDLLWVELEDENAATDSPSEDQTAAVAEVVFAEPAIITALPTSEIELRSADGLVSVVGIITAYDDALITIKTSYGTVGIENDGIGCVGATCPTALLAIQ